MIQSMGFFKYFNQNGYNPMKLSVLIFLLMKTRDVEILIIMP